MYLTSLGWNVIVTVLINILSNIVLLLLILHLFDHLFIYENIFVLILLWLDLIIRLCLLDVIEHLQTLRSYTLIIYFPAYLFRIFAIQFTWRFALFILKDWHFQNLLIRMIPSLVSLFFYRYLSMLFKLLLICELTIFEFVLIEV